MSRVQASIIVRTYNEARSLPRLLAELNRQRGAEYELLVVDSGSDDGTVELARRAGARVLHISKDRFTFGRSLNLGCDAAEGEILVFISAHCYPEDTNWLRNMLAPFGAPETALTYGRQLGGEVTKFSEHRVFERNFPSGRNGTILPFFCNNANAAVRADLWRSQRFDEDLPGLEDLDWARRIMQRGFKVTYVPDAPVFHIHEETWRQVEHRYMREAIALNRMLPDMSFDLADLGRLVVQSTSGDVLAAWRERRMLSSLGEIIRYRWHQHFGTYRGFRHRKAISQELKLLFFYGGQRPEQSGAPRASGVDIHTQPV